MLLATSEHLSIPLSLFAMRFSNSHPWYSRALAIWDVSKYIARIGNAGIAKHFAPDRVGRHMETFRQIIGPDEGADTLQLCARAVLLFAFGVLCIRIAGRRTFAQYSPLDIVVALIVGSSISRVMTGKAAFFPALSATLVLVVLHRVVAVATLRWRWLSWLVKARPICVIENGRVDPKAMKRANLSHADLHEAIRMEQIDNPADIKLATIEGGGKLSVVPKTRDA